MQKYNEQKDYISIWDDNFAKLILIIDELSHDQKRLKEVWFANDHK